MEPLGILLAAGRGRRYDASGARWKLLEAYPCGSATALPLAQAAARNLRRVLPVLAVVRGDDGRAADGMAPTGQQLARLRGLLEAEGCEIVSWSNADKSGTAGREGSGASIACAVRARPAAGGWIVTLADMPCILPATIAAVRQALIDGARTVAPYYRGQRGHPVGFGPACYDALAALEGDEGARRLLLREPPLRIDVDDPGILFDIDACEDLAAMPPPRGPGRGAIP